MTFVIVQSRGHSLVFDISTKSSAHNRQAIFVFEKAGLSIINDFCNSSEQRSFIGFDISTKSSAHNRQGIFVFEKAGLYVINDFCNSSEQRSFIGF